MATYLLGLDYGTGGAKACIIDLDGAVLAYAFQEYALIHAQPGWSEHDASQYWPIACALIQQVVGEAGIQRGEIAGIAASSALPSVVMINAEGDPLHHAYTLMDRRATDEVRWIKEHLGENRVFEVSGYRLEDHPVLVNVLWEKRHRPGDYAHIHKVLTVDGYITYKLTGQTTLHYSAAAFYGVAYNLRERHFEPDMLAELGLNPAILPGLCSCTDVVGEVSAGASHDTGLLAGIPVAGGQVDCNASWIGAGAINPGAFQCNLGSVGNFGIIHKDTAFNFSEIGRLMINFPYTVDSEHTYVTVPTTMTGGSSLRYIRDNLSHYELEAEKALGTSAYDLLTLQAEGVPAGSDGLIVLPFLAGERTPIWDVNARGVIFGLSLHHTKGHMVRAMLEGVAYAMYDSYRLVVQAGLPINFPMVMNEGGAVSRVWRQIISDVFNVPITLVKNRAGAPYGDAILAGVATGIFSDFTVVNDWVEYVDPMEPNPANHDRYMDMFGLFKDIYTHTKADFERLASLR